MSKAAQLKHELDNAREYVGKIGRPQHHFGDGSVGTLHDLKVTSKIHHQERTCATNYWDYAAFDGALARVVRNRFSELAKAALELMEQEYKAARIAEKDALLAQLAEIQALEAESATPPA